MERDAKSAWHRVKNADEIWIYLRGDPLNLWCLDNDNKLIRNLILDSNNPVEMIPSGYWQAAKSTGEFTLVSCCVGPGCDLRILNYSEIQIILLDWIKQLMILFEIFFCLYF